MPRMNPIDRALKIIDPVWDRHESRAQKGEANNPKVGEIAYDNKRDAAKAMASSWETMTPEARMNVINNSGGVDKFMEFMGKGEK
jgi:hypothetical protein|tara:strand:+ start:1008 stop:1262 length:255 start_codon:yes stop_codon:yes gene_type:complete